jgi:hypothetical protein
VFHLITKVFVIKKIFLKVCSGTDSNPPIPNAPAGQIAGWFSEYAEGKVYLCGGQDTDIHKAN